MVDVFDPRTPDVLWIMDEDETEWGNFGEEEAIDLEEDEYQDEDEDEEHIPESQQCCKCIHCIPLVSDPYYRLSEINDCEKYPPSDHYSYHWYSRCTRPECSDYTEMTQEYIVKGLLEPMSGVSHEMLRLR
jgi:hypothetical protein